MPYPVPPPVPPAVDLAVATTPTQSSIQASGQAAAQADGGEDSSCSTLTCSARDVNSRVNSTGAAPDATPAHPPVGATSAIAGAVTADTTAADTTAADTTAARTTATLAPPSAQPEPVRFQVGPGVRQDEVEQREAEQNEIRQREAEQNEIRHAVRSAALLGQPITLYSASRLPLPIEVQVEPSSQPTTFLELPDLDDLQRARFSRRRARPDAAPPTLMRPSRPSSAFESLTGFAARPAAVAQLDSAQPASPQTPQPIPQPENPLPEPLPLDLTEPAPSALPQSAPEPAGGQILTIPTPETPLAVPAEVPSPETTVPVDPQTVGEVVEVRGDRQEFDERQQIFRADGNVEVRFRRGVLTADRVRVNLTNRLAVAEGNAALRRGQQVLRGERFEYSFGLNQGNIQTARGELLLPGVSRDFNPETTTFNRIGIRPVTEQVSAAQPVQVVGSTPGPAFGLGNRSANQGQLNRLRFEAERAEFDGETVVADNVSITNDPFSPPELELRSNRVTYRRLSPFQAEVVARNPRLVFDNGFSLPLLVNRLVLDNRERDPGFISFGFDERDRDGFYVERLFTVYSSPLVNFTVSPQLLIQRAIDQGGFPTDLDHYGLVANADFQFTPNTTAQAIFNLSSLNFSRIDDSLRMSLRAQQRVFNHTVALEYSYRNRLFNGSLGFQDIHSSIGLVVTSPRYILGNSQINLSYQGSVQYINAQTDQAELYNFGLPDRDLSCIDRDDRNITGNGCADLTRYQAAVTLSRLFFLWVGTALPATPTEGLRYSPTPITPFVGINLDTRGVYSGYSSGDHQASLRGGVTLLGQFGQFSRPLFDYTAFSLGYANTLLDGESPFLFDRVADEQVLTASLTQQIYGPLRFGVQVSYNLTSGDDIDTVYTLEYSRRTYTISANYSTGRRAAALTFRLNDFNWTGDAGPFSGLGSDSVEDGVVNVN
ncbi:MAG: DUF3769 domain-containing protein [Elainella sp.]